MKVFRTDVIMDCVQQTGASAFIKERLKMNFKGPAITCDPLLKKDNGMPSGERAYERGHLKRIARISPLWNQTDSSIAESLLLIGRY